MKNLKYHKIAAKAVALILQTLKSEIRPGICGKELAKKALEIMTEKKVKSSILGYQGFPEAICVSLNNELTHGIPDQRLFVRGDLVSIDVACNYRGFHADAALTTIVAENETDREKRKLLETGWKNLDNVIQNIKPNITTVQDIGGMIEKYAKKAGFFVIKEYGGHGIGQRMHEKPFIPNYCNDDKTILRENMLICVEPLIQLKDSPIRIADNKWTVLTKSLNAHFEHTLLITKEGVKNLTAYE